MRRGCAQDNSMGFSSSYAKLELVVRESRLGRGGKGSGREEKIQISVPIWYANEISISRTFYAPRSFVLQHFLYFFPLPHGHLAFGLIVFFLGMIFPSLSTFWNAPLSAYLLNLCALLGHSFGWLRFVTACRRVNEYIVSVWERPRAKRDQST